MVTEEIWPTFGKAQVCFQVSEEIVALCKEGVFSFLSFFLSEVNMGSKVCFNVGQPIAWIVVKSFWLPNIIPFLMGLGGRHIT